MERKYGERRYWACYIKDDDEEIDEEIYKRLIREINEKYERFKIEEAIEKARQREKRLRDHEERERLRREEEDRLRREEEEIVQQVKEKRKRKIEERKREEEEKEKEWREERSQREEKEGLEFITQGFTLFEKGVDKYNKSYRRYWYFELFKTNNSSFVLDQDLEILFSTIKRIELSVVNISPHSHNPIIDWA